MKEFVVKTGLWRCNHYVSAVTKGKLVPPKLLQEKPPIAEPQFTRMSMAI